MDKRNPDDVIFRLEFCREDLETVLHPDDVDELDTLRVEDILTERAWSAIEDVAVFSGLRLVDADE